MRNFNAQEIADINQRDREVVSKVENDAHRRAEDAARAERLRKDVVIRLGLKLLRSRAQAHSDDVVAQDYYLCGYTADRLQTVEALDRLIHDYDYLDTVPVEAFHAR